MKNKPYEILSKRPIDVLKLAKWIFVIEDSYWTETIVNFTRLVSEESLRP